MEPTKLDLADYRQRVAAMFLSDLDLDGFRKAKDDLFATHSQSPIEDAERASFQGLRYYPPTDDAIVEVPMSSARGELAIETNGPDGAIVYERVGILETPFGELTLWWIKAYGGGLFLPFRDGTSARDFGAERTYGAGRYLVDTVKGTFARPLRVDGDRVRLDFNYAYNASCAYSDRWACPLAPEENRVSAPVRAGEMVYHV
jgi:uncharacterized protein (DUF1684 family)